MADLEEMLRQAFRRKVARAPAHERLADRAISTGRRARARRTVIATVAAAVAVTFVGTGVVSVIGGASYDDRLGLTAPETTFANLPSAASTTVAVSSVDLPVSVVVGDTIWVADRGGQVSLAGLGTAPDRVWRTDQGWLIEAVTKSDGVTGVDGATGNDGATGTGSRTLWYLPGSGSPVAVVTGQTIVVGRRAPADGTSDQGAGTATPGSTDTGALRVAWSTAENLSVAALTEDSSGMHLSDPVRTPAPILDGSVQLQPQALAGDAVVLAGTRTGGELDVWDVWSPAEGDFVAHDFPAISLHGVSADGDRLIGRYRGDSAYAGSCLAELDPARLVPVGSHSLCPSPLAELDTVLPSPDGRWWMVIEADGAALYDAQRVWLGGAAPDQTVTVQTVGGAWDEGGEEFVVLTLAGVAILIRPGQDPETASLPASSGPLSLVVTDLR